MTKKTRRRFTPEYKEQAVARLSEPGVTYAGLSAELGITSGQLKTWHLELLAAGSATAIAQSKSEAAELAQLRRDVKRLKEENEGMRIGERVNAIRPREPANAFFRSVGGEDSEASNATGSSEGRTPSLPLSTARQCIACAMHERGRPRHRSRHPFDVPGAWRESQLVPCLAPHNPGTGGADGQVGRADR